MGFSSRMSSAVCVIALACAACSAAGTTNIVGASATMAPMRAPSAAVASGVAALDSLLLLDDSGRGGSGLWRLDAGGKWTAASYGGDATALAVEADGILVTNGRTIETRLSSELAAASSVELKWPASAFPRRVVALDRSPSGEFALVTQEGTRFAYYTASADGKVGELVPAPAEQFTPMIAWLDDTRLLVLSTGSDQVSRLAIIDTAAKTLSPVKTIGGITSFALSGDRKTLAAASGSEILAGPIASWIGGQQLQRVVGVEAGKVVWGLALDQSGDQLAVLSGVVSADGSVSIVRDACYARSGTAWLQARNVETKVPAPKAQIWLP